MDQLFAFLSGLYAWPIFLAILSPVLLFRPFANSIKAPALPLPSLPEGSPQHWALHHLPLLGSALPFFSRRRDMLAEGRSLFLNENFSFFVGKKHIVNLDGLEGRKTFFESKHLSVPQGAIELLAGFVSANDDREDYGAQDFIKSILTLTRPAILAGKLSSLVVDTNIFCRRLALEFPSESQPRWRVMNPFETVHSLIFRLIMRVIGVSEWLDDEKLMHHTLSTFCKFEKNCSRVRIVFPFLMTLTHLKKLFYGAMLYRTITKVIEQRKAGKRRDDAIQFLLEQDKDVVRFLFSVLASGITTEGCSASWLTVFLAYSPEWQAKCRAEIDSVIAQKLKYPGQSANDILRTLQLQEWETNFPVIVAAFRETVRLAMCGAMFRKNASGSAVSIGTTGEVIPDGAYASFLMDNTHMDPALYPEPSIFNPGRYLSQEGDPDEQEPGPHTFVGWGSGRHPCPGMRLAKLQITIVMVHLLSSFEFEPSDRKGSKSTCILPTVDRNTYRLDKPKVPILVRYKSRE
ncbi:hypothetical protein QQS21_009266 [Conoideocrella luteorostrata]|uniref:Cytochrome P450 n=1 Tax=Conoideocrella luteorostrata TaxID=1105319 RepID=A0AAJ0CJM9_9HYPO|nr:hypothetical protein QQS21_009266 [Conoideocrella luteorostrata]